MSQIPQSAGSPIRPVVPPVLSGGETDVDWGKTSGQSIAETLESLDTRDSTCQWKKEFQRSETIRVWGVPFDRVDMHEAIQCIGDMIADGRPRTVITANLNYVMLHDQHEDLHDITQEASMIVADGQPIVWRTMLNRFFGKPQLPKRVAGSEMLFHLAQRAARDGWRMYFLGGEPGVAEICATRLTELYPGLQVAGVEAPPFRELTPQEQEEQDDRIRKSGADILLVAFGQPKGERWISQHHQRLGVPVSMQVGASFDFVANRARRAPKWIQRIGMEWAHRMMSDPARLLPRYAANAKFLCIAMWRDWS
ncbi:MAG: WecB/TagA/CpsF family glycosyltransferase, partial [Planctomycetota bacterium]